ncbi:hypothetical protein [Fodinicurvata sediminis]|uniref:hypothetical protein n=1 Tax=Fodinicurvata sediminis TaxID=1121832 RepID=UPI0003B54CE2|nr:hypothetical protein [Fodinicurvata sediminis]
MPKIHDPEERQATLNDLRLEIENAQRIASGIGALARKLAREGRSGAPEAVLLEAGAEQIAESTGYALNMLSDLQEPSSKVRPFGPVGTRSEHS